MDETMRLIQDAHAGDKEARDRLVLENVGLIWSIVRRFSGRGYELEDVYKRQKYTQMMEQVKERLEQLGK